MAIKKQIAEVKEKPPIIYINREDSKEKPGGTIRWLAKELPMAGYRNPLVPERTSFVELNDGSYWVYIDGERSCFGFTKAKMDAIDSYLS